MVAYACNLSIKDAEAGKLSLVGGQPGLHSENISTTAVIVKVKLLIKIISKIFKILFIMYTVFCPHVCLHCRQEEGAMFHYRWL